MTDKMEGLNRQIGFNLLYTMNEQIRKLESDRDKLLWQLQGDASFYEFHAEYKEATKNISQVV